ncbi:hypothetical protein AB833_26615 [Chromatiales bacterium (ex Bugula neritina AB1)]|nr:hypothetical protein AB833_26615 [Chromatiales bacterium (ex Bugula neritina AB1)]
MSFEIQDIAGLLGVLLYIGSYMALQLGYLDGNSLKYSVLNGFAATFVLLSLLKDFNLASALIQLVWITISLGGMYRHITGRFVASDSADRT